MANGFFNSKNHRYGEVYDLTQENMTKMISHIDELEKSNKSKTRLIKDICSEWNEKCDPECSGLGHTGSCKSVDIGNAKRAMKARIEELERENKRLKPLKIMESTVEANRKLRILGISVDEARLEDWREECKNLVFENQILKDGLEYCSKDDPMAVDPNNKVDVGSANEWKKMKALETLSKVHKW